MRIWLPYWAPRVAPLREAMRTLRPARTLAAAPRASQRAVAPATNGCRAASVSTDVLGLTVPTPRAASYGLDCVSCNTKPDSELGAPVRLYVPGPGSKS